MELLEVNTTTAEVIDIVQQHLDHNTGCGLARFGDGELYILNNNQPREVQQRFCRNWGYEWPAELQQGVVAARTILHNARHATIIGLLDEQQWQQLGSTRQFNKHHWQLATTEIEQIGRKPEQLVVCGHQLPRSKQFGDPTRFKQLVAGRPLHIISCNVEQLQRNALEHHLDTTITYTAVSRQLSIKNRHHYFAAIDNIKEQFVIFGGGAGIKDTATYLQQQGKVCLDFGATLDAWAGIISRPWFGAKQSQRHCVIDTQKIATTR